MEKSFIKGYEKFKDDFGYYPLFHDDNIYKIEITGEGIIFYIDMQTRPEGMDSYPKVKLSFLDIKNFSLDGEAYGCVSIIFDIQFEKIGDLIKTELSSSVGTCGVIYSEIVEIDVLK